MPSPSLQHEPQPEADDVLDTLGLYCPIPLWETAKRLRKMERGQVLEVLSDDDGIEADMPVWCRRTGNELIAMTKHDTIYHAYVRKTAG